ncbi:MAG: Rne/Rng family ribonuclease, partial [Micropruina sp.]
RGEDIAAAEDDPTDVIVRVREPRRARVATTSDEVTGIDGSTRMEAKRQRRREGRAAGRRRAPILSEAEFLTRREAVDRKMLIRQRDDYTQIGVLEDGILVEHYVDRAAATSLIGNIYLGRVQNVLPSMEAAFIDIGRGRNAVLYAGEVDWDGFGVTGSERKVEKVLKSGQSVLVQVSKDPVGSKGARLTSHISLPGRYVVYSPSGQLSGISRKLSEAERNRLKGILDGLIDDKASVIVRTAAEGATEEELVRDVNRLKAQWDVIEKRVRAGKSPEQLYAEPDLTVRIVRDLFTEDFSSLIVDGNGQGEDAFDTVQAYVTHVAAHLQERLVHWNREVSGDVFSAHRLDEQIAKALERKVFLPSGGSLIIDRTEAMTVIDVNTGRFTGTSGNLEMTVTSNNLEAAEEIVRQLRLRDIGGIIVIDFIDMVLPSNRDLLLRRLVECLGRDRTRHQVAEVTSLGLVQMTRKKIGTGLAEAFTITCEACKGRGYHRHDDPVETQVQADGGDRENGRRRR